MLRCKMRVKEVTHVKDYEGNTSQERITLDAVYSDEEGSENAKWSRWTPLASFTLHVDNPSAMGQLLSNHEVFVDFTLVK